jgi:hypothetical protein
MSTLLLLWRFQVHVHTNSTSGRQYNFLTHSLSYIYTSIPPYFQYSGGQATEGQGGYYGSGGSRVIGQDDVDTEGRNRVIAMAADVQRIQTTVAELDELENLLRSEEEDNKSDTVTSKTIELKNSIKKLITSKDVVESLNSLEIQGSPVWGLSTEEREMIVYLRDKMNE